MAALLSAGIIATVQPRQAPELLAALVVVGGMVALTCIPYALRILRKRP